MEPFSWWTELTHHGILISAPVLKEKFKEIEINNEDWRYKRLRDHYNTFLVKEEKHKSGTHPIYEWINYLFEEFLGHDKNQWLKGSGIPQKYTVLSKSGLLLKPKRILLDKNRNPLLFIQTDSSPRLGMYRGRRSYSHFLELLRKTNVNLGILTNGHQIRLIYAGLDHDAWTQWQFDNWFEEGELRSQLNGFLTLLSPSAFKTQKDSFPLLEAIEISRERQADLATILGDQIRQAVEILTSSLGQKRQVDNTLFDVIQINPQTQSILTEKEILNAIYQAATRMVMRMVFLFYAEAKNLLPKDNTFYDDSYGIEGLYIQLAEAFQHLGQNELESRFYGWPRLLGLCKMVHDGSEHEIAPIKAYGGRLFREGDTNSSDSISRALTLFENTKLINDCELYSILRLIKIGKTKVKQGRSFTWISGPVDFTELRTEYIGIMYEGLLDYELKMVEKDSPKIILNLGNQPILPLALLEPMDDKSIKNLFDKLKKEKTTSQSYDIEESGLEEEEEEEPFLAEEVENQEETENTYYQRALDWAIRAVEAGRLIKPSRKREGLLFRQYEENKLLKAKNLLVEVLEPGDMYLVRWGGNRKGTGTFYTKPPLAVPTTHRTLEPLVYDSINGKRVVKNPNEILKLNICDPSVGSGTFLVAAARYLTESLYESLLTHILKDRDENGNVLNIPPEIKLTEDISFQPPPIKSSEEGWEDKVKARLKRLIVEHCLFGVDLNGMAVELARLALWLETMDKELPFEFLDHRIKQGNSLVGSWFCHFLNYSAKAWERQDGTGSDKKNKRILREKIKPELINIISSPSQYDLFKPKEPTDVIFSRQLQYWKELEQTSLLDTEKREEIYRDKIEDNPDFRQLKHQFDRWTAIWFWPTEDENKPIISPLNLFSDDEKIKDMVQDLKLEHRFFHWELEFPEVFSLSEKEEKTGFDALIGNPPWDIQKPNSQEFFTNFDPIYRTYGKQEALRRQKEMFQESPDIEKQWIHYKSNFKALSNYVRNVNEPYEISLTRKKDNEALKRLWRLQRKQHPYKHCKSTPFSLQGSADINLYKLFLEQSLHLLKNGGRIGMIIPSGIYTDKGSTELRRTFLEKSEWIWLYGFENRKKIFDIDSRYKFGPIIIQKGSETKAVKCAFMRHELSDWENRNPDHVIVPIEKIKRFSPNTLSFMEFKSEMDLKICEKIYGDRPLLGDQVEGGWNVKFSTEFHMTNDSHLFHPISDLKKRGLNDKDMGFWINEKKEVYYPLYEGRMIGQFDFSEKGWVSGRGRSAVWRNISFEEKKIEPQYLMKIKDFNNSPKSISGYKIPIMNITSATNSRTVIAGFIKNFPCAHSINPMQIEAGLIDYIVACSILNSFAYDYMVRMKMGGLNLSFFVLQETVFPNISYEIRNRIILESAKLLLIHPLFIPEWNILRKKYGLSRISIPTNIIERKKIQAYINSLIFYSFNFNSKEISFILSQDTDNPTGFFRVDREFPVDQRLTTITLDAFNLLKEIGINKFLNINVSKSLYKKKSNSFQVVWDKENGWCKSWQKKINQMNERDWIFLDPNRNKTKKTEDYKGNKSNLTSQLNLEIDKNGN